MTHSAAPVASAPAFKEFCRDGIRWIVREDCMCVTHAILFDKLHQHEQHPELSLVRENKVRASFFMKAPEAGERQFFIKRYKVRGWQDVAKYIFLPLKAVSEWRNLRLLDDCGLPVPPPVAIGIKKSGVVLQDSCLIVEALLNTQPLNEYVAAQLPLAATEKAEALKQSLALSLARLAAEIHNKKIYYRDLHAGNILIRAEDNGQYQLFLIDLHRAWKPFALLEWMKIRDIAQLCNSLPELCSERRLFIGRYLKDTCSAPESFQSFNNKLEAMTQRLESRRIKSRSKRCMVNSTTFEVHKSLYEQYYGRRDFGRRSSSKAIEEHACKLQHSRTDIIKETKNSVITTHEKDRDLFRNVCVKHYFYRGLKYLLKSTAIKSRAVKSWIAGNGLLVRGMSTPVPLALAERKFGPFIYESFLISEWLSDVRELNDYIRYINQQGLSSADKTSFIQCVATAIRNLHEKGVYHADLKSTNILVREEGPRRWSFHFIDLERVKFKKNLTFRERANNLAQINASIARCMTAKDRLKFFRFYANGTQLFGERKKYYREVLAISKTKNTEPFGVVFK
jgi:tRNA A-37 threonylcarbamoyl transferase component Bud32